MSTALKEIEDLYLKDFREFENRHAGASPSWLNELRSEGMQAFAELGFPTTRLEDWRFCNMAPIAGVRFQPAPFTLNDQIENQIRKLPYFGLDCPQLVFVNGHYVKELSSVAGLPGNVKVASLAETLKRDDAIAAHLARYADHRSRHFVALNTAFIEDGAFIEVPKGVLIEKPIHILYVSADGNEPWVAHPRNLMIAGPGSQAALIETHIGLGNGVYFNNVVTEIVAEENAHVNYVKVQHESETAFHVASVVAYAARNAALQTNSIQFGARLGREDLTTVLDGEGAESYLYGLYVTNGQQLIDNHTAIDHAQPHCSSREFYKGILDGKSTGVFNGKILVRKDAQKTDSKQSDKNLLLSESATINTKPQLEIFADDVKCTHGATIGQIDPEAVFYLRSRGLALEDARNVLIVAFGEEILNHVKFEPYRKVLKAALTHKMKS